MLDKTKTSHELGAEIEALLIKKKVNTPMDFNRFNLDEKIEKIAHLQSDIMRTLELDLKDDSMKDTPIRVAKMFIQETCWGLDPDNFPRVAVVENKFGYDQMLIEGGITVKSMCEHHFVPFIGKAAVAYIPNRRIIGLSKINRIVEYFSRRPQVQERLTEQIYHTLAYVLDTEHVAVLIKAQHLCVLTRGVEDENSVTITSKLGGAFFDVKENTRIEFMNLAKDLVG